MKDLALVDPQTSKHEHCGVVLKKRVIGTATVWLTYDEADQMWWIIVSDNRLRKIGYIEAHREVCWETFDALDDVELAKLQSWSPGQEPDGPLMISASLASCRTPAIRARSDLCSGK